jgi:lipoyl(octanoyl) transferase
MDHSRAAAPAPPSGWHLWIDETPRPGWANMSIDVALLDRAEQLDESWLRLYQWDPYCLSFGRHEPATTRYDTGRIRALGLDTVRRPTGGRAVWHARELTYAIASPCSRFGSLGDAYLEIHRLLTQALSSLGVVAALAPRARTAALDAGACFDQPVGGEVLVNGRKVIGSAQVRRANALLQHGSILLHDDQHSVTDLIRSSAGPGASGIRLADQVGNPLAVGEVADAVARVARLRWAGAWEPVGDPSGVLRDAGRHHLQFRSSTWTWAR